MKTVFLALACSWVLSLYAMAEEPTVVNFQHVVEGKIYRGGRPTESQWPELKDFGIRTVISLQGGDYHFPIRPLIAKMEPGETPSWIKRESKGFEDLGVKFINTPIDSTGDFTKAEDVEVNEILEAMQDPANFPIFLHCEHGNDRTGLIAALYRVEVQGDSWQDALKEWKALGHKGIGRMVTYALDEYFFGRVRN